MTHNALVIGGNGLLGRAIARQLDAQGIPFASGSRSAKPAGFNGRWRVFDASSGLGLAGALVGRTVVFNCATSQSNPTQDISILERLIDASEKSHFYLVHISVAGIEDAGQYLPYYKMKHEGECLLMRSGIPHTIIRPTQFHSFVDSMLRMLKFGPFVVLPKMSLQPLDVDYAAREIVDIATGGHVETDNVICGPEVVESRRLLKEWLAYHQRIRIRAPSLGPLRALSSIRPVFGRTGGTTWSEWNRQRYAANHSFGRQIFDTD